jgi:WD40 repeat protein
MLFRSARLEKLGQVISLALSNDSRFVFAGGSSGGVACFELKEDGDVEFVKSLYKHGRDAGCMVVSPKFPFVLSGGEDGTVAWQPYDERSSSLKTVQVLKRKVLAAHLFKDRNEAIATDGQSLIRFSLKNSEVLDQRKLGTAYPQFATITPDGTRLAVSYGRELRVFDAENGRLVKSLESPETIWSALFHPTQPWIISGGRGQATVWNIDSAERLAVLDAGSIQYVNVLAVTTDGNRLALIPSSAGQSIKVYDLTK